MFKIIPAIDIYDGQAVRLIKGDYEQRTVYSSQPEKYAAEWSAFGRIHLVDLNGAREGKPANIETIKKIRAATDAIIELGGGLRSNKDIKLALDLGIDKVILGSIALKDRDLTAILADKYGDKIIVGIDARHGKVAAEGWLETSEIDALTLLKEIEKIGVQEVIFTDISKDGMLQGPNFSIYEEIVPQTKIKIIASGGISSLEDIKKLKQINGLYGTIVGKALYENKISREELLNIA